MTAETERTREADRGFDVVVAGYAGLDLVWQAGSAPGPGHTAILSGPVDPEPLWGGCGPRAAFDLARFGLRTALISWLGDDRDGSAYLDRLQAAGVDTRGVVMAPGQASPRTFFFYDPTGGATCCYHPSGSRRQTTDETARDLVAGARALALTVAPAALTEGLLGARRPGTLLAWNVKADADAYPLVLRRRLLAEVDLVCLNRHEVAFLLEAAGERRDESPPAGNGHLRSLVRGTVVITGGAEGTAIFWLGGEAMIRPQRVAIADPTGAGDAFFAAFLAALLRGNPPDEAGRAATDHAVHYLRDKAQHGAGV
jgi:sugar/nucleoside kinase (ribokinase family)